MKVIILAGGSGTRLWPLSREALPKQFLRFGDAFSLLQKTALRFLPIADVSEILIITHQNYYTLAKEQLTAIDPAFERQILVEPEKKNTGPAILLGIKYFQEQLHAKDSDCILISSSDHLISPEERFLEVLPQAERSAKQGFHIVFGIRPNRPETGYGYIKTRAKEGISLVERFVEKPTRLQAQEYLLSGAYLWNSGIFLFQIAHFLKEMQIVVPEMMQYYSHDFKYLCSQFYEMPDLSIDYALMEKTTTAKVIPLDLSWSDVGSWESVYEVLDKDENQNVKVGNVLAIDTKNCLIMANKRLISTIGLEELVIIETEDALLIGKKGESQKVKSLVSMLRR